MASNERTIALQAMRALYHELAHCSLCHRTNRPDAALRSLDSAARMLLAGTTVAILDCARVAALIPTEWEHQHERDLAAAIRVAIVNNDYSALRAWGQS